MRGEIIAVKFWLILFIKWVQKNYLDPLLDLFLDCTTRDGSIRERKYRQDHQLCHFSTHATVAAYEVRAAVIGKTVEKNAAVVVVGANDQWCR